MHIYDPARFPMPPNPRAAPTNATVEDYRLLQKRIGTTRVVIVQPRNYATDNRVTLYAISQLGPNARGVAVVTPAITDAELKAFHAGGIRGIRFSLADPSSRAVTPDMVEPLAKRVADLGWHVQFNVDGEMIDEMAAMLRRLPTPMVFDHLAHPPLPAGIDHSSHKIVRELIDKGRTWVKALGRLFEQQDRPAVLPGGHQDRAGVRQGGAGAPGVGQRLAAPWLARQQQAERRAAVRPADRVGPRRGHAQPHPGAESRRRSTASASRRDASER